MEESTERGRDGKRNNSSITDVFSVKALMLLVLLILVLSAGPVLATENGGSHYPGGNEDFMAGALPPPGMYPISYFSTTAPIRSRITAVTK